MAAGLAALAGIGGGLGGDDGDPFDVALGEGFREEVFAAKYGQVDILPGRIEGGRLGAHGVEQEDGAVVGLFGAGSEAEGAAGRERRGAANSASGVSRTWLGRAGSSSVVAWAIHTSGRVCTTMPMWEKRLRLSSRMRRLSVAVPWRNTQSPSCKRPFGGRMAVRAGSGVSAVGLPEKAGLPEKKIAAHAAISRQAAIGMRRRRMV